MNLLRRFYYMHAAARVPGIGKTALADGGGFIGEKTINYCSLTNGTGGIEVKCKSLRIFILIPM